MPFARCSLAALLVVLLNASITFAQVTFKTSSYSAGDLGSSSIAFGDFNNDGLIDMVSVNATTLSFYKGMGAGKFAAPVNATLPQYMGQVVAADLNGDGKLDLLIAPG